mmetsp:Transcript_36287/g.81582  ORF Transcript_36287/g.81582 Transcript_36287/m.81582 type:complete len:368 (+) Transcript_36287:221-1324(+)
MMRFFGKKKQQNQQRPIPIGAGGVHSENTISKKHTVARTRENTEPHKKTEPNLLPSPRHGKCNSNKHIIPRQVGIGEQEKQMQAPSPKGILHKQTHYGSASGSASTPAKPHQKLKFDMKDDTPTDVQARVRFMSSGSINSDPSQVHLMACAASIGSSAMSSTAEKSRDNIFDRETARLNAMGFGDVYPKSDSNPYGIDSRGSYDSGDLPLSTGAGLPTDMDTGLEVQYCRGNVELASKWQQMSFSRTSPANVQDISRHPHNRVRSQEQRKPPSMHGSESSMPARSNSHSPSNASRNRALDTARADSDCDWAVNWGRSTDMPAPTKNRNHQQQFEDEVDLDADCHVTFDITGKAVAGNRRKGSDLAAF